MAKVLFTWELGGGLGHVVPYIPLIRQLLQKQHSVYFALQNTSYAKLIAAATHNTNPLILLQSPILPQTESTLSKAETYADLLRMNGYHSSDNLQGALRAWCSLYDLVRPDVLLCNYSPTALLAARRYDMIKCTIGTGFFSPPKTAPLPPIRFWEKADKDRLLRRENHLLAMINHALEATNTPSLEGLYKLFDTSVDILTTYPELDHYPLRNNADYVGIFRDTEYGQFPGWPDKNGARIFAYLKPAPDLPCILDALNNTRYCTLIYCEGIGETLKARYPNLRFATAPVKLSHVLQDVQLVVTNANHDTLAACLLHGKPSLQLPITLEQFVLAKRSELTGATKTDDTQAGAAGLTQRLDEMLGDASYTAAAQSFAQKYNSVAQDSKINAILAMLGL